MRGGERGTLGVDPAHAYALASHTGLDFTPHIRGKCLNVLCFVQPRTFFYSLCSEK